MTSKRLSVLLAAAALAGAGLFIAFHERGFAHILGIDTQASQNYDFVSGVGPMILTALGMTTIVTGLWRHVNCHVDGCPRIGRYNVAGGQFKVCRRHHPDDQVRTGKIGHHHIASFHRAYHDARP